MRRFGTPATPERRYIHRPGAYAILLRGTRVLLTQQTSPVPEFQLPGGGIDPGESPVQALHREVFEETGWRIGPTRRITTYRRFTFMPDYDIWAEKVCAIYLARPALRLGPPTEPDHRAVWVPLAEAGAILASSGDRAALARVVAGRF